MTAHWGSPPPYGRSATKLGIRLDELRGQSGTLGQGLGPGDGHGGKVHPCDPGAKAGPAQGVSRDSGPDFRSRRFRGTWRGDAYFVQYRVRVRVRVRVRYRAQ